MGETYQNLRAQGKSVVIERQENLVIERSENNFVKRKQTIIREKFEKDAISPNPHKQYSERNNKKAHKSSNHNQKLHNKRDRNPESQTPRRDPEGTKRFSVPEFAALKKKIDNEIATLKKRRHTLLHQSDNRLDVIADAVGDGVRHEKTKRNAAIQNDMTWDQNFNANNPNIHYTFERYSSQQKLLTARTTKGDRDHDRDERTITASGNTCRPRMRTIGLQKNTGRTARVKEFCGLNNLRRVHSTIDQSTPTAFACFDYGPSCAHIGDHCHHGSSSNNNNSSCQRYSQRYNMTGNYKGVMCNQNTYVERGFTPCSEYNYCCDEYYYDYSQMPAVAGASGHLAPCCCRQPREICCSREPSGHRHRHASVAKRHHHRRGSDLNTEEFYERRHRSAGDNGRKRAMSKSPQRSEKLAARKLIRALAEQQCALELEKLAKDGQAQTAEAATAHKSRRSRRKSRGSEGESRWERDLREQLREESAAKIAAALTQGRQGKLFHCSETETTMTTTTTDDQNGLEEEEEKLLAVLTREAKKFYCPGEDDGAPSSLDEMNFDPETLATLKTMRISEYKPGRGGEAAPGKRAGKKSKQYEKYIKQYKHDPDGGGSPVQQEETSDDKKPFQEEIRVAALDVDPGPRTAYDGVKEEPTDSSHVVGLDTSKTYSKLVKEERRQDSALEQLPNMVDYNVQAPILPPAVKLEHSATMEWTPTEAQIAQIASRLNSVEMAKHSWKVGDDHGGHEVGKGKGLGIPEVEGQEARCQDGGSPEHRAVRRTEVGGDPHEGAAEDSNVPLPAVHDGFQRDGFQPDPYVDTQSSGSPPTGTGLDSGFRREADPVRGGRHDHCDQEEVPRLPHNRREFQQAELHYDSGELVDGTFRPDEPGRFSCDSVALARDEPHSAGDWVHMDRSRHRSRPRTPISSRDLTPRGDVASGGQYMRIPNARLSCPDRTQREEFEEFADRNLSEPDSMGSYDERPPRPNAYQTPPRRLLVGKEESLLRTTLQNSIGRMDPQQPTQWQRQAPRPWPETAEALGRQPGQARTGLGPYTYPYRCSTPRSSLEYDSGYPRSSRDFAAAQTALHTNSTSNRPGLALTEQASDRPRYIPGPRPCPDQYCEELREEGMVYRQGNAFKFGLRRSSDQHYRDGECEYTKETKEELQGSLPNESNNDDQYRAGPSSSHQVDEPQIGSCRCLSPSAESNMAASARRSDILEAAQQIPEFTGCPCMLETYLDLVSLVCDGKRRPSDMCNNRRSRS